MGYECWRSVIDALQLAGPSGTGTYSNPRPEIMKLKTALVVAPFVATSIAVFVGAGYASMSAPAAPTDSCPPPPEVELRLILEVNATDNDGEIVLEIKTDASIERLTIKDPSRRSVLAVGSNDRRNIGLSQILLETAEPSVPSVLRAYPEGTYSVLLRTTDHDTIRLHAELSHDLPDAPVITFPAAGQSVPANGVVVTWLADPEVVSWTIELENDELGLALTVLLPGAATSFAIPDGFLLSGEEYQLGLWATGENGNVLVVEQDIQAL